MISAIDRKLLRDLGAMRGQVATIALVIACGVAAFVTLQGTWYSLEETRRTYYERHRFPHVFASLKRAPTSISERIAAIAGVTQVDARIVRDVLVPMPGIPVPAVARLVSVPGDREPTLNLPYLRTGRYPAAHQSEEVLVSEAFADAHALAPGDTIPAVIAGNLRTLRITGTALSPEFVFAALPGDITTDPRLFGVLWMNQNALASAFELDGAFNDISLRLAPNAASAHVTSEVDRILSRYGGIGAYERDKHPSDFMLRGELDQLKTSATWVPAIFLLVAAFLLNVVLSRLVTLQRQQIAALKALGYSNLDLGLHYLKFASVIAVAGTLIGIGVGAWFGRGMTNLYAGFFQFPYLVYSLDPAVLAIAMFISIGAAIAGTLGAVRRVASLPPAEAMRPQAPARYREIPVLRGLLRTVFGPTGLMVVREVMRRPLRTALSALGVGAAIGILLVGRFGADSFAYLVDELIDRQRGEDLVAQFSEPQPIRTVRALAHTPGVIESEALRTLFVRARAGPRWRDVGLVAMSDQRLRRLIDLEGNPVAVPREGAIVTRQLADRLLVAPGESVTIELREGRRQSVRVPVTEVIDEPFGLQIYMQSEVLHQTLGEARSANEVLLRIDPAAEQEVIDSLSAIPAVTRVARKAALKEQFQAQTGEWMATMTAVLTLFATIIAIGVVYNNARVALSMRSRDLGSLRVLGFTKREVASVLLGEISFQAVLAIPIGLYLGRVWSEAVLSMVDPEAYRFPLIISPESDLFAVSVVVVSTLVCALLIRRRVYRLDLIAVLKTRE